MKETMASGLNLDTNLQKPEMGEVPFNNKKKCREISGKIGPHLEGGTVTSVTLELVGN